VRRLNATAPRDDDQVTRSTTTSRRPTQLARHGPLAALVVGTVALAGLIGTAAPASAEKGIVYAVVDGRELELRMQGAIDGGRPAPAVLLIHGGGWRTGDATQLQLVADLVEEQGWVAVSPEYRLDEEPGYPAEPDDIALAVRFVREHADEYGIDPDRIALVGSSAGGNIALATALRPSGPLVAGERVVAAVALSGPTDLRALVEGDGEQGPKDAVRRYLGCEPEECPDLYAEASPTSYVDPGDPAVLLANSQDEIIPEEQVAAMAGPLEEAGVEVQSVVVPGTRHGHGLIDQVWPDVVVFLQAAFDEPIVRPPHPDTDAIIDRATGADEEDEATGGGGDGRGGQTPDPRDGGTSTTTVDDDAREDGSTPAPVDDTAAPPAGGTDDEVGAGPSSDADDGASGVASVFALLGAAAGGAVVATLVARRRRPVPAPTADDGPTDA
jgi:acetyl esterase